MTASGEKVRARASKSSAGNESRRSNPRRSNHAIDVCQAVDAHTRRAEEPTTRRGAGAILLPATSKTMASAGSSVTAAWRRLRAMVTLRTTPSGHLPSESPSASPLIFCSRFNLYGMTARHA